jgi:predicted  nucleic acid-binding Zn-ribbon protein
MTLEEAQNLVQACQHQLQAAQQALSAYQMHMWDMALSGKADNMAKNLGRLQGEVAVCESALLAARNQLAVARWQEQAEQVVQLRKEADAHDSEVEAAMVTLNELRQKMAEVQNRMGELKQLAATKRRQADTIEYNVARARKHPQTNA